MTNVTEFDFKEENDEEVLGYNTNTNWPDPLDRWRIVYEVYNQSIEELYYWAIDNLKEEEAYPHFHKITDLFAASEQSAFFGVSQQRLGLQQDKASQFLATVGKMVKELFQLVRELRVLDERMEYYEKSKENDEAAEITLKGYWIDLVEGGSKNPASVYGMSRELGFAVLPDLFFSTPPIKSEDVDAYVGKLLFNRKVKEVLARKLKNFLVWKEHTEKELSVRRTFTLKYLKQHYEIIRMYTTWVKPYLRNVRKLEMDDKKLDTAHLIGAFEGSMIEIEVLAVRPFKHGINSVMSLHFDYRSRPEMKFQQEGYQRGPVHVGRTTMTMRTYSWSDEELEKYKQFKMREDFDLLSTIDESVKAAYTALGDELEKYLAEAETRVMEKKESTADKPPTLLDPFISIFKGFGDMFKAPVTRIPKPKKPKIKKPTRVDVMHMKDQRDKAKGFAKKHLEHFVRRFKAAHGFVY